MKWTLRHRALGVANPQPLRSHLRHDPNPGAISPRCAKMARAFNLQQQRIPEPASLTFIGWAGWRSEKGVPATIAFAGNSFFGQLPGRAQGILCATAA